MPHLTADVLHAQADALWVLVDPEAVDAQTYSATVALVVQGCEGASRRATKWIDTLHRYEDHWRVVGRTPRENTRARDTLGADERRLGEWARYQRRFEDQLNAYQRARLDVSPAFEWDPLEGVWRANLVACAVFFQRTGDLPRLNGDDAREFALARWLGRQLHRLQVGDLAEHRVQALHRLLKLRRRL